MYCADLAVDPGVGAACADARIREKSPGECKKVEGKFADNEKLPTFAPAIEKQRSSRRSSPADVLEKRFGSFKKRSYLCGPFASVFERQTKGCKTRSKQGSLNYW